MHQQERLLLGLLQVPRLGGITLQFIWCVGMYALWADAHTNSTLALFQRRSGGTFRIVVDLAAPMREDLGEEVGTYDDGEIRRVLGRCGNLRAVVERGKGGGWGW